MPSSRGLRRCVLSCLLLITTVGAPALAKDPPAPSPKDVHRAIDQGRRWLETRFDDGFEGKSWHDPVELVMLTLAHCQVDRKSEVFQQGLKVLQETPLRYTYRVSVLAMTLGHLNPYLHRARLAHCAQWLVNSQLPGGEWGYPGGVGGRSIEAQALRAKAPDVKPHEGGGRPPPIAIERSNDPKDFEGQKGDFSNTQFAILGLKACLDAQIRVPEETWSAALDYMKRYQQSDGGWGYVVQGEQDEASYASLTAAGAVGAAICHHGMGARNPKGKPEVRRALAWLEKHWDPASNDGIDESAVIGPSEWQHYHLYSVERVGSVLGLKKLGGKSWYAAGARWLLKDQKDDGSWVDAKGASSSRYLRVADTCFALLFLTQATPALTGG